MFSMKEVAAISGRSYQYIRKIVSKGQLIPDQSPPPRFLESTITAFFADRPVGRRWQSTPEGMLNCTDAAAYLGVSESMIHKYLRQGRLKPDAGGERRQRSFFWKETLDKLKLE